MTSMSHNRLLATLSIALLATSMLIGALMLVPNASAKTINVTITAKESGCPTGKTFCFDLGEISADVGDTIVITLVNAAANNVSHDLKIDEFGVELQLIAPGEQDSATFTVDSAGTFTYYCSVPGHRQLGMEGSLVVAGGGPSPGLDITFVIGITAGVLLAVGVVAFIIISARRKQ
ncbi:MAG: plastocyanin/azurin family copper-binding protein [Thermoplasmata archaeon]